MEAKIITKLVLENVGKLVLSNEGLLSSSPIKYEVIEKTMKITGGDSSSITYVNGNGTTFKTISGSIGTLIVGNNMTISNGVVNVLPGGSVSICKGGNFTTITANSSKDAKMEKTHTFPCKYQFLITRICSSGNMEFKLGKQFHNEGRLSIAISGTGKIMLENAHFTRIKASVSGSGYLDGGNSTADELDAAVSGSGKICGFVCKSELDATASGCGNIDCSANKDCEVEKNVSGTGSIEITRV